MGCILIMGILAIPFLILGIEYIPDNAIWMMIGGICGGLSLLPHELLHAICYKKDVYMYNDLAHGLIFPQFVGLGLFGIICIGMGFGDYLNIYNAIKQMPKNSKTYLCGMHSYWYL